VPAREVEISVVVPSHERPLRLRWLLNALEEQTLDRQRWELIVVHDSAGEETEGLLREHGLAADGTLRHFTLTPGTGLPSVQRNTGWRAAAAPLVAFTDDDCRPVPEWLEQLLFAARENPGAIVQGAVKPDPFEEEILRAPYARTIEVDPPGPFAQTANILYPRDLLERLGGFEESLPAAAGEDTDLALRARAGGAPYVGAREALVYHAIESSSLIGAVKRGLRWQHLAYVVKHHPEVRSWFDLGIFWRRSHALFVLALVAQRRSPAAWVPYLIHLLRRHGLRPRGVLRAGVELPGRVAIDAAEIATLIRGSIRYRTVFL
jgi:glycosyltransferase involved in cell wall biosynthesis